jgi:hypothetical protein
MPGWLMMGDGMLSSFLEGLDGYSSCEIMQSITTVSMNE